ncbi:MAG: glycoside hydrolase family 97 catalytic domain-containing protein, partial [Bacteroidales bacterium]
MRNLFVWGILYLFVCCFNACNCDKGRVNSPDGSISLIFSVAEDGSILYNVSKGDSVVLNDSRLGFKLKGSDFYNDFLVVDMKFSSFDEEWNPIWGEESVIRNNYNEMLVSLLERSGEMRRLDIRFRVFDDGYGFRYEFPEQETLGDFVIMEELTEFAFADNHQGWSIPMEGCRFYEGLFTKKAASEMNWVTTPVTFEGENGLFMTVHEANLTDYAAMNLKSVGDSGVMRAELTPWSSGECVRVTNTRVTPWRTMIIAECAGDLILSRLMLNLNEPCKIEDTSWIKPMRYIGVWWSYHMHKNTWYDGPKHGATTENVLRYMEFAAKNNFDGVLVEGWNQGWYDYNFSFTKPYDDFDIQKITDYGREVGVELIGHHETGADVANYVAQMEDGFKFYNKYGVGSVKTGYVDDLLDKKERHSSQYGVNHYRDVIELAAKYHITIDNHEPVIPTGLQRTYPNLMTQEGVRGQEWDAWSSDGG